MSQYLLSLHTSPTEAPQAPPSAEQQAAGMQEVEALNADLRSAGAWVFGGALHGTDSATVVRSRDGEVVTTDGPFAETREHLAGFYIIEAADLDEALAWAARTSAVVGRPIEVRPFRTERGA